jgi:hypothetical protein
VEKKIPIRGRPRQGASEKYVILEEPDSEPVKMHYVERLKNFLPHYTVGCPFCDGTEELKPTWYVGSLLVKASELCLLELTDKCFGAAAASARRLAVPSKPDLFGQPSEITQFTGLLVTVSRADFEKSPRVLRCEQRIEKPPEWNYRTREELARSCNIRLNQKTRIYREETA